MFLKNKNIIFEIRKSKVTDYAALTKTYYRLNEMFLLSTQNICDPSREKGRVGCHIVKFTFSAF